MNTANLAQVTWAIGGHDGGQDAALFGDTRARWRGSDRTFDRLRTVHLVGDCMAVAYVGSVHTGLSLVSDLQRFRREAVNQHEGNPEKVVDCWRPRAQQVAARIGAARRGLGVRLLIVAASGSERSGWILEAPRFVAQPLMPDHWGVVVGSESGLTIERLLTAAEGTVSSRVDESNILATINALGAAGGDGPVLTARLSNGEQRALSLHREGEEADIESLVETWKQFKITFGTTAAILAER